MQYQRRKPAKGRFRPPRHDHEVPPPGPGCASTPDTRRATTSLSTTPHRKIIGGRPYRKHQGGEWCGRYRSTSSAASHTIPPISPSEHDDFVRQALTKWVERRSKCRRSRRRRRTPRARSPRIDVEVDDAARREGGVPEADCTASRVGSGPRAAADHGRRSAAGTAARARAATGSRFNAGDHREGAGIVGARSQRTAGGILEAIRWRTKSTPDRGKVARSRSNRRHCRRGAVVVVSMRPERSRADGDTAMTTKGRIQGTATTRPTHSSTIAPHPRHPMCFEEERRGGVAGMCRRGFSVDEGCATYRPPSSPTPHRPFTVASAREYEAIRHRHACGHKVIAAQRTVRA